MKFYITGTRRGLGKALKQKCDIFINCKHDRFEQVDMLYKAAALNKRIINIGSHASDFTYLHQYAVEKRALREANNQMFIAGKKTTCLNFGYFDTERSAHKDVEKMPLDYVIDVIEWVLIQEYNVKELTVCA